MKVRLSIELEYPDPCTFAEACQLADSHILGAAISEHFENNSKRLAAGPIKHGLYTPTPLEKAAYERTNQIIATIRRAKVEYSQGS